MSTQLSRALAFACSAVLIAPSFAEVPDEYLRTPLAELYGTAPTIDRPRLSPDASKLLYLIQDPQGIYVLQILDFATGESKAVLRGSEEEYDIGWCEWANETRVICDFIYAVNADGSDLMQIPPGRIREPTERHASLCTVNAETRAGQIILDWFPDMPEYVQRTCGSSERLNIYTGQARSQRAAFNIPGQPMSDGHGFARLQRYRDVSAAFDRWYFRTGEGAEWVLLHESNPQNFEDPFRPIGFGSTVNELYHLAWDRQHWSLYGINLAADATSVPIFARENFDVDLVDMMGAFDRVVAVAYLDGRPQRFVVDEPVAAAYATTLQAFPDANVEVVDESWDGNSYLVLVRPPRRAGNYYVLDMREGSLVHVGPEYAHLAEVELAETRTVSFPGSDGRILGGHLTLPGGRQGPMPTVIIPRGLVSRLDVADPHYLVQFLTASGYAVLRFNYSGDARYGGWLPERAALGWRQAADDVSAAAAYVAAEGIAAPDRICALGHDLGAYAALMNNIVDPAALDCIIGIATVSDARALAGSLVSTIVGDDDDVIRLGSPVRRSKEITAPVQLFAGNYDGIVSMFAHTLELNRALEGDDKDVQFWEYRYGRNQIDRGVYRIDMLARIGAFLAEKIGTP
jgi:dipeptidyl aminopeptidase/acylaminoacyl peptidase